MNTLLSLPCQNTTLEWFGFAQERMVDWSAKFQKALGLKLLEVTGDTDLDELASLDVVDILCTTPEKFGGIPEHTTGS